ncbi:MAG: hypothetical protein QW580_06900 [Nitrososphaerota archaeon]
MEADVGEPLIDSQAPPELASKINSLGVIQASTHTPVYKMHKFWARSSWRLFKTLIQEFTRPSDLILDILV